MLLIQTENSAWFSIIKMYRILQYIQKHQTFSVYMEMHMFGSIHMKRLAYRM